VILVRLFGVDPASLQQELANQARLSEFTLQRLRADLEAARRVTGGLMEHQSLLATEVARLEAEQRILLSQLQQSINRHEAGRRSAEEGYARETAAYEAQIADLTCRLHQCHEAEEHLLHSLADLVAPFMAPVAAKEGRHA